MKVLIPVFGSHGDVLPFIAFGRELVRRGHEVLLYAPAPFEQAAVRSGLHFHCLGSEGDFEAALERPELRRVMRGLKYMFDLSLEVAQHVDLWIERHATLGKTVVVAPVASYGARIAQERLGLPTATVHIMPLFVESRMTSSRLPGLPIPAFLPSHWRHWFSRQADRYVVDRLVLPKLNRYRARAGLHPIRRLRHWWNSPTRLILTVPNWYAAPQLDWPLQAVQTGFPFADRHGDESDLPTALAAFLDAGDPPLVFVYTTWMRNAHRFFEAAVGASARLGRRCVLLSPHAQQIPPSLPDDAIHVSYAPLSLLLPRAVALVHHGGVGTVATALAAGIPQIVVPFMGDQFDEGERVRRLRVGAVASRRTLTAGRLARTLTRLLADPVIARHCMMARTRIGRDDGIAATCDVIEAMSPKIKLPRTRSAKVT